MPARAVVFDVGHVLFDWDPRYLYEKLIADPDELDWFLANVVTRPWHFQHDAGRPLQDMLDELRAEYPEHAELIAAYHPRWLETIPGPIAGMLDLVIELDEARVPLYAITNFGTEFWSMFRPTAPVFDRFRDIVVSGHERVVKPDPAIFRLALQRFGLCGADALFVDDRPDNVCGAEAAGMAGHVFVDAATTRTWLAAHGVL